MSEMNEKQKILTAKLKEAFDLIKEGDNTTMYVHIVEHKDGEYRTIENLKGMEEDLFFSMVHSVENEDEKSISKNLFNNYLSYAMTKRTLQAKATAEEIVGEKETIMKPVHKSKGDA